VYIAHNRENVLIWSFRLPFLHIFTNLEVQERYLPIIRGAWTAFPCIQCYFNHWQQPSSASAFRVVHYGAIQMLYYYYIFC